MILKNKKYSNIFINTEHKDIYDHHSLMKKNRDYLISPHTAYELNTYLGFNPFWLFADQYERKYDDPSVLAKTPNAKLSAGQGVRSLFNKFTAVALAKSDNVEEASQWRLSNNVPLLDTRANRKEIKRSSACTVKDLVLASENGELGRETYSYSDFMFCKHLGKMPNNYLITLRRFPTPVDDFISLIGTTKELRTKPELENNNLGSNGCLVTWLGTPGNDISNILKYSINMPFKEQKSDWNTVSGDDAAAGVNSGKIFNNIAAAFDPTYIRHATAGNAPLPFLNYLKEISGGKIGENPYNVRDLLNQIDANKVYGPVDAVKSTYMRSEDGIQFEQNISLTFDYELRAYNGINGRQAMLDLIANILAVTYTTGNFWKGGYRGGGAHQNNIFTNLKIFKTRGGFNDFTDAFAQDYTTVTQGFRDKLKAQGGDNWLLNAISLMKSALNMMGGMLLGGLLNGLGRPARQFAHSLLSSAPVGFWHLTIGNPFHPIMSMGNMILKNTTIEHYGPLGLDDFPTGLKVTVELTRGKPRDLREIENIYMHGNDRIYSPMSSKVLEMYKHAKIYKKPKSNYAYVDKLSDLKLEKLKSTDNSADVAVIPTEEAIKGLVANPEDFLIGKNVLRKYMGTNDPYPVVIASMEQEFGASKKRDKSEDNDTDKTSGLANKTKTPGK